MHDDEIVIIDGFAESHDDHCSHDGPPDQVPGFYVPDGMPNGSPINDVPGQLRSTSWRLFWVTKPSETKPVDSPELRVLGFHGNIRKSN
jgi:hypothetical protein